MPKSILKRTASSPESNPENNPEKNNEIDNRNINMPHRSTDPRKKVRFKIREPNRHPRRKKTDNNELRIIYANANGIAGKTESLKNALETYQAQIATIVETKIETIPPLIEGYKWIIKNRHMRAGGGLAILIRDDLQNQTKVTQGLEDHDQEILWLTINLRHQNIFIGVLYGLQENATRDEVERQYSQITTQIVKLKQEGEVILTGDFNSKIEITKQDINQDVSPNGKLLDKMIDETELEAISTTAHKGNWTRVNRQKPTERSIIDYILTTKGIADKTTEIIIDEEGIMRLKGKKESDHNTIMMTTTMPMAPVKTKRRIWNLNNREGWKEYNIQLQRATTDHKDYGQMERTIIETMKNTIGQTTITVGKYKQKESETIKNLRSTKKQRRKEFERACRTNSENKGTTLANYIEAQRQLKEAIEEHNKEEVQQNIKKTIEEGGAKSQNFWKTRRKILGNKTRENHDLVTEEGERITDGERSKEYIASYFEDLYQAREGDPDYQTWTDTITKRVEEITEEMRNKPPIDPITGKELETVIKCLKRGKSVGPDKIPNEIFIEADKETREIYRKTLNNIAMKQEIPDQWQTGEIVRLYKGKGTKGKCSSERGITLASNFGKVFERVINNRALQDVIMTDNQAGGQKGRATVDHIRALNDLTAKGRESRKPVYITFLDVTKAYDKAWLDAILYVLHKQGVKSNLWTIIKKLNENLRAKIQTKHGHTRTIKIRDSIRQGGVLSVMLYALLMDEISKEIKNRSLGIEIGHDKIKEGCLLWMDDVALITKDKEDMQTLLDITNEIAMRYHIKFGKEKSKTVKIGGRTKPTEKLNLGEMELDYTDSYRYLGTMINNKMTLSNQIKEIKSKTEGAYQTMLAIARDQNFRGVEMESIWKLVETCIVPIITYGGETWNPNKKETKELNDILDNILRRILIVPQTTPREALYIDTGLLDIITMIDMNRISMRKRLERKPNTLMENLDKSNIAKGWHTLTEQTMNQYNVSSQDMDHTKAKFDRILTRKVNLVFREKMETEGLRKSKVSHLLEGKMGWKPQTRPKYMNILSRNNCSIMFQARTRMLKIKNNYRNMYRDNICRKCNKEEETQEHILEICPEIHVDNTTKITNDFIFTEDPYMLKEGSRRLKRVLKTLTIEENQTRAAP